MFVKINVFLARLSLYSSDFNVIEILFAILKQWIRRNDDFSWAYVKKYERFEEFLRDAIKEQESIDDSDNLFRLADIQYSIINLE